MEKSSIVRHTGGGGNEPQGRQGFLSKIPFFKFVSKSNFSVSNVNKYYVGVKPQPTLNCVGRIWKRSIKDSPCHPELVSGSYRHQKCSAICTQKSNVGVETPTYFNFSTISYASWKAQRHVRGDLVPAFTLAEVFSPYYYLPRKVAFTLAEVLITLGIIGVVAAMTLPTLMAKYRANVVETRLAKFYTTINQAIIQSEAVNGDKKYWDITSKGWETDEDGNEDRTKPPKAMSWYNKYLKDYLKTIRLDYENTFEGKVKAYFPDGSLMLFSGSSIIFYPEAKDYKTVPYKDSDDLDRDRNLSGIKYFTFHFSPSDSFYTPSKWLYDKGVEPYKYKWDGSRESLFNDPHYGCQETVSNERAYCTALIQLNGWKIPKDYPLRF